MISPSTDAYATFYAQKTIRLHSLSFVSKESSFSLARQILGTYERHPVFEYS